MPRYIARKSKRRTMSRSRSVVRRRPRRSMRGRGKFWESIKNFAKRANTYLKKSKAISNVAGIGSMLGIPYLGTVSKVAGRIGYGKKRRTVRRRRRRCCKRRGGANTPSGGALRLAGTGYGGYNRYKKKSLGITY